MWELHLSHWTGPIATLTIKADWSYRRFDHLYGSLTYNGGGVYGFKSTHAGVPLDTFGRNLYVDTFGSSYGARWKRENSFLTHKRNGTFCYGFYPHGSHPAGKGTKYRATVIGPGVTPDVLWQGNAPGAYDRAADQAANADQRAAFATLRARSTEQRRYRVTLAAVCRTTRRAVPDSFATRTSVSAAVRRRQAAAHPDSHGARAVRALVVSVTARRRRSTRRERPLPGSSG